MSEHLSTHFTLAEFIASETADRKGIDNYPPADVIPALRRTALGLEGVRTLLGVPVIVRSGYRCLALNRMLGSKDSSQHVRGEAADIIAPGYGSPRHVAMRLAEAHVDFDQLLLEFPASASGGWVHMSFVQHDARRQALVVDQAGTRPLVR